MNEADQLSEISKKLSALLALEIQSSKFEGNLSEKVKMLVAFELSNAEIAKITGASKGTVEVLKSRVKIGRKRGRNGR